MNRTAGADDEYTSVVGDNAASGKSPTAPLSSLIALLRAYDLDAGDVIYVDSDTYVLPMNLQLESGDAGVRIQGPVGTGHQALLNRHNTNSDSYVMRLLNADDVTLSHLGLTGGYYGIYASSGSDSDRLRVESCEIYGHSQHGVYLDSSNDEAVFVNNRVHDNGSYGWYLHGVRYEISGGEVYGNAGYGMVLYGEGHRVHGVHGYGNGYSAIHVSHSGLWSEVYENRIHDNGSHGINVSQNVLVRNNVVYGHTSGSSAGINLSGRAQAVSNEVYGNGAGITCDSSESEVRDNRVYGNTSRGINVGGSGGTLTGNVIYANPTGIYVSVYDGSGVSITNNRIYASSSWALVLNDGYNHWVANNTIYQPAGSGQGIAFRSSVRNMRLHSNILWVEQGSAIDVANDSQTAFSSNYNVFYPGASGAIGLWEGISFTNLVDWYYELGLDPHSVKASAAEAAALLVDPEGADGILGFSWATLGGALILDDGDAGFSTTGSWTVQSNRGYNSDQRTNGTGSGSEGASWTFTGLTAGWYRVALTWNYGNSYEYAYNTPVQIYNAAELIALATVDQEYSDTAPNDFTDAGTGWKTVEYVRIESDTLTVRINDRAEGIVIADAVHVQRIVGDHAADDDFHLTAGSLAIDRGDPNTYYLSEPAPNGGRVNGGAYGNTAEARTSPTAELVQVLSPNGLEKYEVGQAVLLNWRSYGLGLTETVLLMNVGGETVAGGALGTWLYHAYATSSYYTSSISTSYTINTSRISNPAPESVYRQYAYSPGSSVGDKLAYHLPVPDGDYVIRLHLAEPSYSTGGYRQMDIRLQGVLAADNYDIAAAAGGHAVAVAPEFTVNAVGGTGIDLELIVARSGYQAILSGLELTRASGGVVDPTVDIALSVDEGATWTPLAAGVGMNRFGQGSYLWTAGPEVDSNRARIKVTATSGTEGAGYLQPVVPDRQ